MLTPQIIETFWRDGYVLVPDAVSSGQLAGLKSEVAAWVEESRAHDRPFGPPTVGGSDGAARLSSA